MAGVRVVMWVVVMGVIVMGVVVMEVAVVVGGGETHSLNVAMESSVVFRFVFR